jgi:putative ABC transport system permease protein
MGALIRRFLALIRRNRLERDLDDELAFHLAMREAEHVNQGVPPAQATKAARRQLGNVLLLKEQTREVWRFAWLEIALQDARFAIRGFRQSPVFTLAAILTIAVGTGATTAIFTVAFGILWRPLPYKEPQSLVLIQAVPHPLSGQSSSLGRFAAPELTDWIERTRTFQSLAIASEDLFAVRSESGLETVLGSYVSERFFETLGQPFALGRPLGDRQVPEVVVSHRFWRRRLAADPQAVGRDIQLNGRTFTICGVTRPDFQFPTDSSDIWTSLDSAAPTVMGDRRARYFSVIARLKPGVTLDDARVDAERVAQSLAVDYPESRKGFSATAISLLDHLTGRVRPPLLLLLTAVSLVLCVACANVANLLLVRQASRSREIAVRVALGASRSRLVRQSLAEAAMLALAGAMGGVAVAYTLVAVLLRLQPESLVGVRPDALLPRMDAIRIDSDVTFFAFAAAALVALLATVGPAVHFGGRDPARDLKSAAQNATRGRGVQRLRSSLVIAELAICLVLLVGAGLLGRSFVQLLRTDRGFTTDRVVTIELNVAMGRTLSNPRQIALAEELVRRVRRLPNVEAVGAAGMLPLRGVRMVFLFRPYGSIIDERFGMVNPTPEYFQALGIPLLKGRLFSESDGPSSPPVMILGASMARRFFGSDDALGKTLPYDGAPTIVGVVGDVKYGGLQDAPGETIYRPFAQYPFRNMFVVIRTTGDPLALASDIRTAIHGLDPEIMLGPVRTLDAIVSETFAQPRFRTVILGAIASVALILAAVGLYGVVAYSVSQRTAEIGVRMALGARATHVVMMVMRQSVGFALAGAAIGSVVAYVLSRTLEQFLYGISPADATSYGVAAGFLAVVVVAATYVPARRATKVDPLVALRCE